MIRDGRRRGGGGSCKPRASGDDPISGDDFDMTSEVNPARAGMIPRGFNSSVRKNCKPRASGDDPKDYATASTENK